MSRNREALERIQCKEDRVEGIEHFVRPVVTRQDEIDAFNYVFMTFLEGDEIERKTEADISKYGSDKMVFLSWEDAELCVFLGTNTLSIGGV